MKKSLLTTLLFVLGFILPGQVFAQLTANFSAIPISGCSPILVQFTDSSTGNPTNWNWNLGNGTLSNIQNPSTVYITPGIYTVTLTVSNGSSSDTKTITNYINVIPSPEVYFTASDSSVTCPPKTVQFTDQTILGTSGAATYFWDFGDGATSTVQNPTHTYTNGGNYTVTLAVTNSAGCMKLKTKTNYIQVSTPPDANFTSANNISCVVPSSVSFTNTTVGGTTYDWDFGSLPNSTAINPTHLYNAAGNYMVTLIATNAYGCKDTVVKPNFVSLGPISVNFNKSASSVCKGVPIIFTNTTTPGVGSCTWNFGDGTTPIATLNATHAYSTAGTFTVKLVVINSGCKDSSMQTVTVFPSPSAAFSATPTAGCTVPQTVSFSNSSTGAVSYMWSFGTGATSALVNPSYTYTILGSYNVALIATSNNNCKDTLTQNAYINFIIPTVTVSANNVNGCLPDTVTFTAISNPSISSYNWNMGNSTVIPGGSTITYIYTTPGTYNVTAGYSTTPSCNFTTTALPINVGTPPSPSFTATPNPACPGTTITFINTSNAPSGTTYLWNFGDGGTDSTINTSYIYWNQGTYPVTLTATYQGCSATYSLNITITPPLSSFLIIPGNCANKKNISTINNSTPGCTYLWDFGDGSTSTLINPTHTYTNFGNYTVVLYVTNPVTGCVAHAHQDLHLYQLIGDFIASDTSMCNSNIDTFAALININIIGAIQSYTWHFGDGTSVTETDSLTTHHYLSNGIFTVTLVLTDTLGCKDTITKVNYIHIGGPIVNFVGVPTPGCSPLTVLFTDQTISPDGFAARNWKFGDGVFSNSNTVNVSHTYNTGQYSVRLIVTDTKGCKDTLIKSNYIIATKPNASFNSPDTIICKGQIAHFYSNNSGNYTYLWLFGDGGNATTLNPTHVYNAAGNYTVSFILTNSSGCKDTMTKTAYVHVSSVNPGFTLSDTFSTCPPLTVFFLDTTSGSTTHNWVFGNGNASSIINPGAIYTLPGNYNVKLVTSNGICTDSAFRNIHILGPIGTFSYAPLTGCYPLTVTFTANTLNTVKIIWDMSNGFTDTSTTNQSPYNFNYNYTYNQVGNFVPVFVLSNGQNCTVPYFGQDTIKVGHLDADFYFTPIPQCEKTIVQFTDSITNPTLTIASHYWTFGDGNSSTIHNPTHLYSAAGTFTVKLVLVASNGCADTITKQITVLPSPNLTISNNLIFCQGQFTSAPLQVSGALTYSWSPAATLSCSTCTNPYAFPTSTTTYTVVGTAANGCTDTAQVTIGIDTIPQIIVSNSQTICSNDTIQLSAVGAANFSWSPSVGLSCSLCPNPIANPQTTVTYTVIGTNLSGCADTDHVTLTVIPAPNINAGPDITICKYGQAQLHATGLPNLTWNPSSTLSCPNCSNPIATPLFTTPYVVSGVDNAGCNDSDTVVVFVNPLPIISIGNDTVLCAGKSLQLNASGAVTYIWSPPFFISCVNCPNPIIQPNDTTTYTVIGVDSNGCKDTASIAINIIPKYPMSFGVDDSICIGDSVTLFAIGGTSYLWSPAATLNNDTSSSPIATPLETSTYQVIITQGTCFTDTGNVTISVFPWPTVNAGPDQTIIAGNSINLFATSTNTISYVWEPSTTLSCATCQSPVANPTETTTYIVTAYNELGCEAKDEVTIFLICDNGQLFLANTFTPNGDGHNDRFYPQGKGMLNILQFSIYNRWGEKVFEANNIQPNNDLIGWDGTYKGETLTPDVYVYVVKAVCYTGDIIEVKGDISLIR